VSKPTIHEVVDHVRNHFGLTLAEAIDVMKTPTHPAGLRDKFAAKAMQMLFDDWSLAKDYNLCTRAYRTADAMLDARVSTQRKEP
jgi:hypothetical protein